ncbi:MAG: hypothetical protein V4587_00235 [Acidobacteriota bacterium]
MSRKVDTGERQPSGSQTCKDRTMLGLELLSRVAMPKVCYTQQEIAAWCGCSHQAIYQTEKKALRKLRHPAALKVLKAL